MVKDVWGKAHFYCESHPDTELVPINKGTGYYECPVCKQRVTYTDVFTLFGKISDLYSRNDEDGSFGSITSENINVNKRLFCTIAKEHHDGALDLRIKVIK